MARLRYLTRTPHALAAAREAGLTVTDRTVKAWLAGRRSPSPASLRQIETAYRTVRRQNVARYLLRRLRGGGGTRVEIHLLDTAWAAGDLAGFDRAWTDVVVDVGSQWGQYDYVSNIGFAA
jgi:hypothetical protein